MVEEGRMATSWRANVKVMLGTTLDAKSVSMPRRHEESRVFWKGRISLHHGHVSSAMWQDVCQSLLITIQGSFRIADHALQHIHLVSCEIQWSTRVEGSYRGSCSESTSGR